MPALRCHCQISARSQSTQQSSLSRREQDCADIHLTLQGAPPWASSLNDSGSAARDRDITSPFLPNISMPPFLRHIGQHILTSSPMPMHTARRIYLSHATMYVFCFTYSVNQRKHWQLYLTGDRPIFLMVRRFPFVGFKPSILSIRLRLARAWSEARRHIHSGPGATSGPSGPAQRKSSSRRPCVRFRYTMVRRHRRHDAPSRHGTVVTRRCHRRYPARLHRPVQRGRAASGRPA